MGPVSGSIRSWAINHIGVGLATFVSVLVVASTRVDTGRTFGTRILGNLTATLAWCRNAASTGRWGLVPVSCGVQSCGVLTVSVLADGILAYGFPGYIVCKRISGYFRRL